MAQEDMGGSVGSYLPYGEDRINTSNDAVKFATYTRDSLTGLEYAKNRYYQPGVARFTSSDPYTESGGVHDPSSWNRCSYSRSEPVGRLDRQGSCDSDLFPTFVAEPCDGNTGGGPTCAIDGLEVGSEDAASLLQSSGTNGAKPTSTNGCYSVGGLAICWTNGAPPPLSTPSVSPPDPFNLCEKAEAVYLRTYL